MPPGRAPAPSRPIGSASRLRAGDGDRETARGARASAAGRARRRRSGACARRSAARPRSTAAGSLDPEQHPRAAAQEVAQVGAGEEGASAGAQVERPPGHRAPRRRGDPRGVRGPARGGAGRTKGGGMGRRGAWRHDRTVARRRSHRFPRAGREIARPAARRQRRSSGVRRPAFMTPEPDRAEAARTRGSVTSTQSCSPLRPARRVRHVLRNEEATGSASRDDRTPAVVAGAAAAALARCRRARPRPRPSTERSRTPESR